MTSAEYHDALRLLDAAADLLSRKCIDVSSDFRRELRRLTVEFDLLRIRISQPPADRQRN